jgi:hypothetical protein
MKDLGLRGVLIAATVATELAVVSQKANAFGLTPSSFGSVNTVSALPTTPPLPALIATSSSGCTGSGWQCGYFGANGLFVSGNPSWGTQTNSGGSFNNADSSNQLARQWQSNFNGQVQLTVTLRVPAGSKLNLQIRRNGNSLTSVQVDDSQASATTVLSNITVQPGDYIDFMVAPTEDNWSGSFSFDAKVEVPAGLVFTKTTQIAPNPYANPAYAIGKTIPTPNPFTAVVKSFFTVAANIRDQPNLSGNIVGGRTAGQSITFDAWTRGELVNASYGIGDRWYRLAGTNFWMSETTLESGPPPIPTTVALDMSHVGMLGINSKVYESYPGYAGGTYYDPFTAQPPTTQIIAPFSGVQAQHSLGAFIHQSFDPLTTPVLRHRHIDIPDAKEAETLQAMLPRVGAGYLIVDQCPSFSQLSQFPTNCFTTPEEHKGLNGSYSPAGFIEAVAEQVGLGLPSDPNEPTSYPGYIPTLKEFVGINNIMLLQAASFQSVTPASELTPKVPPFTPEYLEFIIGNPSYDKWLNGWLESAYFTLTDPDGYQLGYTEEQGLFSSIPGVNAPTESGFIAGYSPLGLPNYVSPSPPSSSGCKTLDPYDPVEKFFQFFIPNRKDGQYKLQLTGQNNQAKALIGSDLGGDLIYTDSCDPIEVDPPSAGIPEPSSILGLLASGGIMGWLRSRKRLRAAESKH